MSWRRVAGLAVAAVALVATGCGGDDAVTSPVTVPDTRDETPGTSDPADGDDGEDDEQAEMIPEVEQAYLAQWEAYVEILSAPDPANPLIDQHYTGSAREQLLDTISDDIANGYVTERPANPEHFSVDVDSVQIAGGDRAVVLSCLVDGLVLKQADSGGVLNDDVASIAYRTEMVFEDGRWKISEAEEVEREEGADGCDGGPSSSSSRS